MINKGKIFVALVLSFFLAGTALAAEFIAPAKGGDPNVTISASETRKNLYAVGANVSVNGRISGDLFVGGGMVSLIGDVEEDLNVVGGSLSLSGRVGGDARVAGGNITVSSPVGGDLLVAGGNVSITEKSSIGGDLVIGGGNIILDAPVKGSIRAGAGNITINSKVGGDVQIMTSGRGRSDGNLTFGPRAEVLGTIKHKGTKQAVVKEGAKIPKIEFTPYTGKKAASLAAGILTLAFLIKLLAWFFAGLILAKYRKGGLERIAQSIKEHPWENLGLGLAGLVVIPIAVILLLAVLVGYYIAAILAVWYVLLLMFAYLVGVLFFGAWLRKLIAKTESFVFDWKAVLLGVVVIMALKLILPPLGWLVYLVLLLVAMGALLRLAKQKWVEGN